MRGWNRTITSVAVLAGGLLGLSTLAFAAAGSTTTTVTPLASPVTYSRVSPLLETYIGYTVTIVNPTGNTLNQIRFEAAADVSSSFSVDGRACSPADGPISAGTVISCPIGQLAAGTKATFTILFAAPTGGPTSFTLSGRTVYGEGTSPVADRIEPWGAPPVALVDPSGTNVTTTIPKTGGEFATIGDQFNTKITVPSSPMLTVGKISELAGGNCNNFVACHAAVISIRDSDGKIATFAPYLTIVLYMDAANIKKGAKIGSVTIEYLDEFDVTHIVGQCASLMTPNTGALAGIPCIAKATQSKTRGAKGNQVDFVWEIINTKNGRFTLL